VVSRVSLRRAVVTAHRWFGVAGALGLRILEGTDALLAFRDELVLRTRGLND